MKARKRARIVELSERANELADSESSYLQKLTDEGTSKLSSIYKTHYALFNYYDGQVAAYKQILEVLEEKDDR